MLVPKTHISGSDEDMGVEVEELEVPPSGGARGSDEIAPPWRAVREEVFEEEVLDKATGVAEVVATSPEPVVANEPSSLGGGGIVARGGPRPPTPPPVCRTERTLLCSQFRINIGRRRPQGLFLSGSNPRRPVGVLRQPLPRFADRPGGGRLA